MRQPAGRLRVEQHQGARPRGTVRRLCRRKSGQHLRRLRTAGDVQPRAPLPVQRATHPVSQVLRRLKDADAKRQLYHAHHMLWSDSGAANNYAQGRCMAGAASAGSRSLVEMIEDNAQAVARGFGGAGGWSSSVLFHSLAGGSGSGVSGALLNALGDVTRARSMCVCVAPLNAGETCTQAFNTVRPLLSPVRPARALNSLSRCCAHATCCSTATSCSCWTTTPC